MAETTLIVLTFLYVITVLWLFSGINRAGRFTRKDDYQPSVCVIVPARNEESYIEACLDALAKQEYPSERYVVYIVNDRSTDSTQQIAATFCDKFDNFHLINMDKASAGVSPKKAALQAAIDSSESELIFTTDADCKPSPGWIKCLTACFSDTRVGMTAGYSPLVAEGGVVPSRLLRLDALALAAVSAGSAGAGYPVTCTGRSLSYRREAFRSIGGFEGLWGYMSGDDDLLLHKMNRAGWRVAYVAMKDAQVPSVTSSKPTDLSHQRRRHASKSFHYYRLPGMLGLKLALPLIYAFNFLLLLTLLGIAGSLLSGIAALAAKSASEFLLLYRFSRVADDTEPLLYFPLAAILHPVYIIVFGGWGALGGFVWKGRRSDTIEGIKKD